MKNETPIKKIVAIGPESTGKSTLCKQVAEHFHTFWCPEYAREYLFTYGKNYTYEDLLIIAKGQLQLEDEYLEKVRSMKYEVRNADKDREQKTRNKAEITKQNWKLETANWELKTGNWKLLFIDTD